MGLFDSFKYNEIYLVKEKEKSDKLKPPGKVISISKEINGKSFVEEVSN